MFLKNRISRREWEGGGGGGYVIGSYTSLSFRALWNDVDWTLAETAEHLSSSD